MSKWSLKRAKTNINIETDVVEMSGKNLGVFQTPSEHYAVPLCKQDRILDENFERVLVNAVDFGTKKDPELRKAMQKLHLQFGLASFERLVSLIKTSNKGEIDKTSDRCYARFAKSVTSVICIRDRLVDQLSNFHTPLPLMKLWLLTCINSANRVGTFMILTCLND